MAIVALPGAALRLGAEVCVFEGDVLSGARDKVRGDPLDSRPPGALYDRAWGTAWFDSGRRVCGVSLSTASGKGAKTGQRRLRCS
jgi:hypothetical protein